jgi:hypothetical protein
VARPAQPSLPLEGRRNHDPRLQAQRTTTLFAALNVLTGVVIGQCLPRHRNGEFLKFCAPLTVRSPRDSRST